MNSTQHTDTAEKHRLSVAPMLDWTDRHYRFLARQISRRALLYTEMIHAGALVYGDAARFLETHPCEHPVALQLGGSEPDLLARAAAKAAAAGFAQINLNCGCPSPRVQKGAFGACLMRDIPLVADCLNAIADVAPDCETTVKHRIGLDRDTEYEPLAEFVGTLARQTPVRTFVVHARNAWLEGLSPKENRDIPPLRYDYVYRLKREFPELNIVINGGITTNEQIADHLHTVDGAMVGREAYHNPMLMAEWDARFYGGTAPAPNHAQVVEKMYDYAKRELAENRHTTLRHIVRHSLGLMHGLTNARVWRRMLSDAELLQDNRAELILRAWDAVSGCLKT
ncbi:tRNA dihydrouridine(20/20a) synthase DusA [Conchiformibius kuhniae]|uniref:tRNA-dihydrouridine(20/20a) synthase n=1 Tax=Conchiformibius kuhniae TaxID=211502 RepID=A0A8T9MTC6_9NEIS|nr:tRNA dihydrouridine(20/20a) synthase DusA [Conchiformibius kuhniae]UOP04511.1 tRNA dihydrouridine(20/20a) synthase DusA [Conchiformibius kuhniae]